MKYEGRFTPFKHQDDALAKMNGKRAFALLMRMRTGKSKCVLDDFGQLELDGKVSDLLVIAPAGCYKTWVQAIDDHVAPELRKRLTIFTWETKKAKGRRWAAMADMFLANRGPRVALINIESLSIVESARAFCIRFLRNRAMAMIVADESTALKSPTARRTKFINRELAHRAEYRRILSGLPTPRSPLDLYSQFEFLDRRILGFQSFFAFQNRYAIIRPTMFGGRQVRQIVGYQNVEELHKKTDPYAFRIEFRPQIPSTYSIREVELTDEQRRLYAEMKNFATARLSETAHVTATVVIAQILRLHQILLGYTIDELGTLHEIPEHRTDELLALLEDYNGKAIIWCAFDYNIRKVSAALSKEYGPEAVSCFWGANIATREQDASRFKTDPRCRFMVATPAAGRFGRDWQEADLVIYYSSSNDLEHREQSEMRAQGLQKQRAVDYIDLIAPGTVELKILHALRKKIDLNAIITGDAWREWIV